MSVDRVQRLVKDFDAMTSIALPPGSVFCHQAATIKWQLLLGTELNPIRSTPHLASAASPMPLVHDYLAHSRPAAYLMFAAMWSH
jgi:hypothetical protein